MPQEIFFSKMALFLILRTGGRGDWLSVTFLYFFIYNENGASAPKSLFLPRKARKKRKHELLCFVDEVFMYLIVFRFFCCRYTLHADNLNFAKVLKLWQSYSSTIYKYQFMTVLSISISVGIAIAGLEACMKLKYQVQFHNFAESVLEPSLYYDHHHLNSKGVSLFTEKFLNPIL